MKGTSGFKKTIQTGMDKTAIWIVEEKHAKHVILCFKLDAAC